MGRRGKFSIIVISGRVIQIRNLFPVSYRLIYFYTDKLRLNDTSSMRDRISNESLLSSIRLKLST